MDIDRSPVDALRAGDHPALSLVLRGLMHLAEHPGGDVGALGDPQDGVDHTRVDDGDHPHAQVESALEVLPRHRAELAHGGEDRRHRPGGAVGVGDEPGRQDPGDVGGQSTASNVGQGVDRPRGGR